MSGMEVNLAVHLPESLRVQLGSFYTPQQLVDRVHEFVGPYLVSQKRSCVVFDSAGGCGAFMFALKGFDYRIADRDPVACNFLAQHFDQANIFCTNSLVGVSRERFRIPSSAFLIMIGNPPYNDTTSEYKSGRKGQNTCDEDLYDRDLGVSFLKSYNKLGADVVCVLHPLSWLSKEANFARLRGFKENYRLVRGELFSSGMFQGTGLRKFPIVVALYERHRSGMTYNYIREFQFTVLGSNRKFVLCTFKTTDGYIAKYPPRTGEPSVSPIGVYYRSFRDLNSIKRNASFLSRQDGNSIVVTVENLYKYAYLYALRALFDPPDAWLYGNLSPLLDAGALEGRKELYVYYALSSNGVLRRLGEPVREKIRAHYGISVKHNLDIELVKRAIKHELEKLV